MKEKKINNDFKAFTRFIEFLYEQAIFVEFMRELKKFDRNNVFGGLKRFVYINPYGYISSAFDWGETNLGGEFWKKINETWLKRLEVLIELEGI